MDLLRQIPRRPAIAHVVCMYCGGVLVSACG